MSVPQDEGFRRLRRKAEGVEDLLLQCFTPGIPSFWQPYLRPLQDEGFRRLQRKAEGVEDLLLQSFTPGYPSWIPLILQPYLRPLQDEGFRKLQRKAEGVEGLLERHSLAASPTLQERLQRLRHKQVRPGAVGGGFVCVWE